MAEITGTVSSGSAVLLHGSDGSFFALAFRLILARCSNSIITLVRKQEMRSGLQQID